MASAMPWIKPRYFDGNGKPLVGGKIWTYQAGTNTPVASYTDSSGLIPNQNPVITDANGYADMWLAPGNYKIVLMDKNDQVLWTKDNVMPADGGGGGIVDGDYVFDGYSARFNEQFGPTTGLMDTLNKIIKITYTAPAISLSASGSGTIYEKGATVSSTNLTATITKRSNPIAQVRFYQGATLIDTQSSGGAIPNGGTNSYTYSTPFSDTISFVARVDDTQVGDDGPTTVTSNTVTFNFFYPYFDGADNSNSLTAAQVATKTKRVIASTATIQRTFTATAGQYLYFAQPSSYPALTQILDVNNFDVTSSWVSFTGTYTALDSSTQTLRVYRLVNPVAAGDHTFTFRR